MLMRTMTFERVSKSYGKILALDDISFNFGEGEIVALIGANGAGKTTTIRLITRYLTPDKGKILIDGKDIYDIAAKIYPIAYIPDEPVYYEFMTVAEHFHFIESMYVNGEYKTEQLISRLSLGEHINKTPNTLSKGTKQKLMICAALLRSFDFLIADEPFSGLDPNQINVLKQLLLEQRARGKAILISTHLLDMIERFCDKYVILDKGKVIAYGTKDDIAQKYSFDKNLTVEQMHISLTNYSESVLL